MNYKNVNDYEMMYLVRDNNDDAVNILLEKYKPIICKKALNYYSRVKHCGVDLQDFIQEGMIAFNRALNSYDENENVLLYTYIIVCLDRHLSTYCRNVCSTKHSLLNFSVRDEDYFLNVSTDDKSWIGNNLVLGDTFIKIKNSFEFLDSNIFELRYNGFSYKEICTLLDISYGMLESRLSKIRTLLRKKEKTFI